MGVTYANAPLARDAHPHRNARIIPADAPEPRLFTKTPAMAG
jgi:hypothetical protein